MESKNDCYYKCGEDRTKYNRRDAGTREREESEVSDETRPRRTYPGEPGWAELDVK